MARRADERRDVYGAIRGALAGAGPGEPVTAGAGDRPAAAPPSDPPPAESTGRATTYQSSPDVLKAFGVERVFPPAATDARRAEAGEPPRPAPPPRDRTARAETRSDAAGAAMAGPGRTSAASPGRRRRLALWGATAVCAVAQADLALAGFHGPSTVLGEIGVLTAVLGVLATVLAKAVWWGGIRVGAIRDPAVLRPLIARTAQVDLLVAGTFWLLFVIAEGF